jgi:penicillin-insensitive murein endopeptidase
MRIAIAAVLALAAISSPLSAQTSAPKPATKAAEKKAAEKAAPKAAPNSAPKSASKSMPAAKQLFGAAAMPSPLAARAIGFYAKGCLAGALALPVNGKTWQVMRLTRNRNWAHPNLIRFLEQFSAKVPRLAGWHGILVGDLSQPRGGPMLTGHTSHQVGLDADIWLTPMPDRTLTRDERETISATMMVRTDRRDIDPAAWTPSHLKVVHAAAEDPAVERIFVNAAIKKALCREADTGRTWLNKVRAYWGHDYHMHIRIRCPVDSPDCKPQDPVPAGDGCGKDLDGWFADSILYPKPPAAPPKPKPGLTMADLPPTCRQVLVAP